MDELVLIVFVHGFKGGADTFDKFPQRLAHLVHEGVASSTASTSTRVDATVEAVEYPPFETKGELATAVNVFSDWLAALVVMRHAAFKEAHGEHTGPVRVVLAAHSMGGLVVADALANFADDAGRDVGRLARPKWPEIVGVVAYDTPYCGLNPHMLPSTASDAMKYVAQAQTLLAGAGTAKALLSRGGKAAATATTSKGKGKEKEQQSKGGGGWLGWAVGAGAAAVAGAGALAYFNRDKILASWNWGSEHLNFAGECFKAEQLEDRMKDLDAVVKDGVGFRCFYTLVTPPKGTNPSALPGFGGDARRTFILVPTPDHALAAHFTPHSNARATSEVAAHCDMFTDAAESMRVLAHESASSVCDWLDKARKRARDEAS